MALVYAARVRLVDDRLSSSRSRFSEDGSCFAVRQSLRSSKSARALPTSRSGIGLPSLFLFVGGGVQAFPLFRHYECKPSAGLGATNAAGCRGLRSDELLRAVCNPLGAQRQAALCPRRLARVRCEPQHHVCVLQRVWLGEQSKDLVRERSS